jgi:hypothetical protein
MNVKRIISIALAVLVISCIAPMYANAQPPLPHAFYGTLEVNDSEAEPGYIVEARGTGVATGIEGNPITTEFLGEYGRVGPLQPKLIVQGDIVDGVEIEFYVNEVSTEQTAEWHSGEITRVDLSVTITAPTPPPGGGGGGGGGGRDTTAPAISGVAASNVTKTSADITWETDEKSDSQVEYWASPGTLTPLETAMVTDHLVHLDELNPGNTYYFKTRSTDKAGNLAVSEEHTFTTLAGAAAFTSSELSISPSAVYVGETVTISVSIANNGDAAGSFMVTLKINGVVEGTKEITLNAGASGEVTFTTAKDVAGTYSVDVDGLSGSFIVEERPEEPSAPPPITPPEEPGVKWPIIWGVMGGVLIVGVIIFWIFMKRRAY